MTHNRSQVAAAAMVTVKRQEALAAAAAAATAAESGDREKRRSRVRGRLAKASKARGARANPGRRARGARDPRGEAVENAICRPRARDVAESGLEVDQAFLETLTTSRGLPERLVWCRRVFEFPYA